jgi:hypothetical protein
MVVLYTQIDKFIRPKFCPTVYAYSVVREITFTILKLSLQVT